MGKVIAIVNQKGGVGKSTTAAALISGLSAKGYKVLGIDLDAQSANLSFIFKAKQDKPTTLELMTKAAKIEDAIQDTPQGKLVAANKGLVGIDALLTQTGKEYRLRESIEPVRDKYDYIIIDTPPMLNVLSVNALTAADRVIIPLQADILSLQGVKDVVDTFTPIKQYCNPQLKLEGLLFTRFKPRTIFSRDILTVADKLAKELGTKVYQAKIRDATAQMEVIAAGQSIFDYAANSNIANDYTAFINEFVKGVKV